MTGTLSQALPANAAGRVAARWEEELESLHPASFAWALGCCRCDREGAEEVLQEVYLKILEGKARFEGRSSFKTWLFAVIHLTAAARRRSILLRSWRFLQSDRLEATDGSDSAERTLLRSERAASLLRALDRLARRQREVLDLVFYHDMTIEQTASVLRVSVGSARVHYQRGKKNLLLLLEQEEKP